LGRIPAGTKTSMIQRCKNIGFVRRRDYNVRRYDVVVRYPHNVDAMTLQRRFILVVKVISTSWSRRVSTYL